VFPSQQLHNSSKVTMIFSILLSSAIAVMPPDDIARLKQPGLTSQQYRAIVERLHTIGVAAIPALLEGWPDNPDPVVLHWFRSTFDDLLTQHPHAVSVDKLEAFATDRQKPGKARRTVLAHLERLQPGTTARLMPTWLNDPEFGTDAVAQRILASESATDPNQAKAILQEAYNAATTVDQVALLARKLTGLGEKPNILAKLGVVVRWRVVGPFDVTLEEGLKRSFPPEMDCTASMEYDGRDGKLRWISVTADNEGKVDLIRAGINTERGSVAYALAELVLPQGVECELRAGAVDNITLWVNGREQFRQASLYRSHFRADRYRSKTTFQAGPNVVLLKLTKTPAEEGGRPGAPPQWSFQLRLVSGNGQGLSLPQEAGQ
jgi:hypothetical protein